MTETDQELPVDEMGPDPELIARLTREFKDAVHGAAEAIAAAQRARIALAEEDWEFADGDDSHVKDVLITARAKVDEAGGVAAERLRFITDAEKDEEIARLKARTAELEARLAKLEPVK